MAALMEEKLLMTQGVIIYVLSLAQGLLISFQRREEEFQGDTLLFNK